MRILFWSGSFWPNISGPGILGSKLLPALKKRGYEFMVISPLDHPELPVKSKYKGIPVYRYPFWYSLNYGRIDQVIQILQQLAQHFRTFKPDVVHIDVPGFTDFFYLHTAKHHSVRLLVSLHGEWQYLNNGNDSLAVRTLRLADWVTGCSAAILDRARELVPEITLRSCIIYNGSEVPSIQTSPLNFDTPRLLCIGRLEAEKGFDLAVSAFESILVRFPKARLIIAGDGSKRKELEDQVENLGLGENIEFTGLLPPDKVPSLINTATIILIPSRFDSLPLVALESALMSRPVVATRVGGLSEAIVDHRTGLLIEKNNIHELSMAITYLLEHPEKAIQLGKAARLHVKQKFNWIQYVNSYDNLYRGFKTRE